MSDELPTSDSAGSLQDPQTASTRGELSTRDLQGSDIGNYKLLELLGEGGFGVVWLAQQTQPVQRRVALKLIKPGMDSKAVIARFEAERQALAMMSHPNVAKVLDAGTTPLTSPGGGRPYFVMEHVKGAPITDYCDKHRLTVEQRLRLFRVVCDAVQHAHMKGIIHRDLKPSNILVTIAESGEPRPVIIDFGVAKALAGRLSEQTIFTEQGQLIGTPEYMSPEQAEMAENDIDTRSDVYSLGVVLYELLTGTVPFDAKTLRSAGYAAIQKMIREADPPRPSTRLSTMGEGSEAAAGARRVRIDELTSQLRRELEWIPLKALRKDRAERYRSASELADDVENYLSHRPLIAGPESAGYRIRKFVRRNKGAVFAGGIVAASLVLATAVSIWYGVREAHLRKEAVRLQGLADANAKSEVAARKRAEGVTTFVVKALQSSDPQAGGRQNATIADAMRNALKEIRSGAFAEDPQTEASLKDSIGLILMNSGSMAEAETLFKEALATRKKLYPEGHIEVIYTLNNLGGARLEQGNAQEAETLFDEALAMGKAINAGDDSSIAISLLNAGGLRLMAGKLEEAEALVARSLDMSRRLHKGDHVDTGNALNALAYVREAAGHIDQAEPLMLEAIEMRKRLSKGDHPDVAHSLTNLAYLKESLGKMEDAERLFDETLKMSRNLYLKDHPFLAESIRDLARVQQSLGKKAEARKGIDEALAMCHRLSPAGSPLTADVLWLSGSARLENGDAKSALAELEEAVTMCGKQPDVDPQRLEKYSQTLAKCKAELGK